SEYPSPVWGRTGSGRIYCDMRILLQTLLALALLTACAGPVPSSPASSISTTLPASFSSRSSLTGEWLGGLTLADGLAQSIVLNFDPTDPTLNIEPRTKTSSLTLT